MAANDRAGRLAVILHADVAGSTALVQQDEQQAHARIRDTFQRFGATIGKYHGHVRELRGDALLGEFERASDAVTAALAFQADQDEHNARIEDGIKPEVRVGIAMGEVIVADDTITGAGVVLAQRIEQLTAPGGVGIQGAAYETIPGRFPFEYENLGEHRVKGFDNPVRLFAARLKQDTELPGLRHTPGPQQLTPVLVLEPLRLLQDQDRHALAGQSGGESGTGDPSPDDDQVAAPPPARARAHVVTPAATLSS